MGFCISKNRMKQINSYEEYILENLEKLKIKASELQIKEDNLILFNQRLLDRQEKLNLLINELSLKYIEFNKENDKQKQVLIDKINKLTSTIQLETSQSQMVILRRTSDVVFL